MEVVLKDSITRFYTAGVLLYAYNYYEMHRRDFCTWGKIKEGCKESIAWPYYMAKTFYSIFTRSEKKE